MPDQTTLAPMTGKLGHIVAPTVSWGRTSTIGVLFTALGGVGATIAAVKHNDVATATAGAAAIVTALSTIGGRMAQAVAAVRGVAATAGPWVDAIQAALAATPPPPKPGA